MKNDILQLLRGSRRGLGVGGVREKGEERAGGGSSKKSGK